MGLPKILILEDNQDCIQLYLDILNENCELTLVKDLKSLENALSTPHNYSLFLADMKVSDGYFLEWVSTKQNATIMQDIPTIIVSSIDDISVLRECFHWGATDYLIKPFKKNELLIKIERLLGKQQAAPIQINLTDDQFMENLTLIESKIFQLFLQNKDHNISREMLINSIWKRVQVTPKTLDVHLSNLRKKMSSSSWIIKSVGGANWRLVRSQEDPLH